MTAEDRGWTAQSANPSDLALLAQYHDTWHNMREVLQQNPDVLSPEELRERCEMHLKPLRLIEQRHPVTTVEACVVFWTLWQRRTHDVIVLGLIAASIMFRLEEAGVIAAPTEKLDQPCIL